METITLHFDSDIKEKLFSLLNNFSKKELKIIEESESFLKAKAEIHKDYEAYISGKTSLTDFEDFQKEMNAIFEK